MNINFSGKTALITGGGRGLGKSIALLFAKLGADVWIGDIIEENAKETVAEIKALGRHSGYVVVDVSKYEDMKKMIDTVEKEEGKIDFLINVAGIVYIDSFMEISPDKVKNIFDTNMLSVSYGCQLALEKMIPRKYGKIINFSSVAGRQGMPTLPHYAASKAGVINLTQSAAYAGAEAGINVNAICPGISRTAMWEKILDSRAQPGETAEVREMRWNETIKKAIPMNKPQEPIDMAWAAAFLCSDYARYITGQSLNVCGGFKMS
ncbi:MAG: SDR family NAD(P)-dependent oxidoreductase [Clostridiaceae bacterium]